MRFLVVAILNLFLVSQAQAHFQEKENTPSPTDTYRQQYVDLLFDIVANARAAGVVHIHVEDGYRYIEADGIPLHETGQFPNAGNPNRIREQKYRFRVPASPKISGHITYLRLSPFGVAVNGVPFDPGAAEFWNNDRNSGWQYEALSGAVELGVDRNNAHVQPNGAYHYHGLPTGLIERLADHGTPLLIGYAADGFPVYAPMGYREADNAASGLTRLRSSYRIKSGMRNGGPGGTYDGSFVQDYEYVRGSGDLDQCNGRIGVTPEYPNGTYYYVVTNQFPFIPRCLKGTPDSSFARGPRAEGGPGRQGRRPPMMSGQQGGRRKPPQEAIDACRGKQEGESVVFQAPRGGSVQGFCRNINGQSVAVPAGGPPRR